MTSEGQAGGGCIWLALSASLVERYAGVLRAHGHRPVSLPVTRLEPPPDRRLLNRALRAREHDLVLLTSAHAVAYVDPAAARGWAAACVGAHTARAAADAGFDVAVVGSAGARALADQLIAEAPGAERVLFLRGRDALDIAAVRLRAGGRVVDEIVCYALEVHPELAQRVGAAPAPDAIVVGSPRAAEVLWACPGAAEGLGSSEVRFLALGPTTAARLAKLGAGSVEIPAHPGPEEIAALLS